MKISTLIIALLLLLQVCCSGNNSEKADAGEEKDLDAAAANGGDSDTDADADADWVVTWDSGPEKPRKCIYSTGPSYGECWVESQCGHAHEYVCPNPLGEKEITRYCYTHCDLDAGHGENALCVPEAPGRTKGMCLDVGTLKIQWQGSFLPEGEKIPEDNWGFSQRISLNIGSITLNMHDYYCIEIDDPEDGHFIVINYIAEGTKSLWNLTIMIPFEKWKNNSSIDFNEYAKDTLSAGDSILVEYIKSESDITEAYIRAINILDRSGEYENSVTMDTVSTQQGAECSGTLKMLFAEYSAEIEVD